MTPTQKAILGGAHGRTVKILDRLHQRATHGPRAKPTVAELNETLKDLEFIRDQIELAVVLDG